MMFLMRIISVSYTHLDVYKRQGVTSTNSKGGGFLFFLSVTRIVPVLYSTMLKPTCPSIDDITSVVVLKLSMIPALRYNAYRDIICKRNELDILR